MNGFSFSHRAYQPAGVGRVWQITLLRLLIIGSTLSGLVIWSYLATVTLAQPASLGVTLRVMSWNAYFLNRNTDAFLQEVERLQPDLIALQEFGNHFAATVPAALRERYPYQELYPTGSPAGMALFSRYPIQSATVPDYTPLQGCNCHVVTIVIAEQPITLINAHPWPPEFAFTWPDHWSNLLGLDTSEQDLTFDALLAHIAAAQAPLLVVGDMNTMPFQPNIGRLRAVLNDSFLEAGSGLGFTFPLEGKDYNLPPVPFARIDYIFHDRAWAATDFAIGTIPGSDHRYVMAELALLLPTN